MIFDRLLGFLQSESTLLTKQEGERIMNEKVHQGVLYHSQIFEFYYFFIHLKIVDFIINEIGGFSPAYLQVGFSVSCISSYYYYINKTVDHHHFTVMFTFI